MQLDQWMLENMVSNSDLGKLINKDTSTISSYRNKKRQPNLETAVKIVKLSKDQITYKELLIK
mgnify:CR=1 FL=1